MPWSDPDGGAEIVAATGTAVGASGSTCSAAAEDDPFRRRAWRAARGDSLAVDAAGASGRSGVPGAEPRVTRYRIPAPAKRPSRKIQIPADRDPREEPRERER